MNSASSKVPHLNTALLSFYNYASDNPVVLEDFENVKCSSKSCDEEDIFFQKKPKIVLSEPPSPNSVARQMNKLFETPQPADGGVTLNVTNNNITNSHFNHNSPKLLPGRISPTNLNPETSKQDSDDGALRWDSSGESPRIESKEKPIEKKSDFQSKIRRSSDEFFNKKFRAGAKDSGKESKETKASSSFNLALSKYSPRGFPSSEEAMKSPKKFAYTSSDETLKEADKKLANIDAGTINEVILNKNEIPRNPIKRFEDATRIFGNEAKHHDTNFMTEWEKHRFSPSMFCNIEQLYTCVENLIRMEIDPNRNIASTMAEKLGMVISPRSTYSQNAAILKLLQQALVYSCSISKRLHEGIGFILTHAKANNSKKTFFTENLYSAYKQLISIIEVRADNFSLVSNLSGFLLTHSEIDEGAFIKFSDVNPSHFPGKETTEKCREELQRKKEFSMSKEELKMIDEVLKTIEVGLKRTNIKVEKQLKKTNANIKLVIDRAYTNHKVKDQIFEYLNLLNKPSGLFLRELEGKIKTIEQSCTNLRKVICTEHRWIEPIVHAFKIFPATIDKISLNDVLNYYDRHGHEFPIVIQETIEDSIKETIVFKKTQELVKTKHPDFWFILFSKLYEAHGYEVKEDLLRDQIRNLQYCVELENLGLCNELHYSKLTPEMVRCLRLLKLGTVNAWMRGAYYWKLRFGGIKCTLFDMNYSENISLNFHIDRNVPRNTTVEQIKNLKFRDINNCTQLNATVPVSWKTTFIPNLKDQDWEFVLRPLKFEVYDDLGREEINKIETFLGKFNDDDSIDQQLLADGAIKIKHTINDKFRVSAQGLQILPAKKQDSNNI